MGYQRSTYDGDTHADYICSASFTDLSWTNGIIGQPDLRACALSNIRDNPDSPDDLDVVLDAARRANWDALHGPRHLRNGRYQPHAPKPSNDEEVADEGEVSVSSPSTTGRVGAASPLSGLATGERGR